MDGSEDTPSTDIDPYIVLNVSTTASANEVKSAYRKLALKHHPDKALPSDQESAKVRFQEIVSAYAILSDERRRRRYDATGNTSESLDIDDDGFDWLDFFRAQWNETVTSDTILDHQQKYQGSDEEKADIIAAYVKSQGNMTRVFNEVMFCNVLDDESRFRRLLDDEIAAGRIEAFDRYRLENETSKKKRRKAAEKEAVEATAHLNELNKKKKQKSQNDMGDLAAMIQQRQQSRATNFLDDLEAKYASNNSQGKGSKGRKRKAEEEPSEEAFQETARKLAKAHEVPRKEVHKAPRRKGSEDEDDTIDLELETEDSGSDDAPEPIVARARKKANVKATGRAKRGRKSKS